MNVAFKIAITCLVVSYFAYHVEVEAKALSEKEAIASNICVLFGAIGIVSGLIGVWLS